MKKEFKWSFSATVGVTTLVILLVGMYYMFCGGDTNLGLSLILGSAVLNLQERVRTLEGQHDDLL